MQIGKMHCHHVKPKHLGGNDEYKNLIFLEKVVNRLLHSTNENTILKYLKELNLDTKQLRKLNKLRTAIEISEIK